MLDEAKFYDAARATIEQVVRADGTARALNEAETRAHLIDPILWELGYRGLDEVRREHRLEASGQVIDYLLLAGEQRVVVEAKPCGTPLVPRDASQLVGYSAQEGIRWALLTNGLQWEVFDVEIPGNWEAKRVARLDLVSALRDDTFAESLEVLGHFAQEALRSGDSHVQAWAIEERSRLLLDRLITDPDSSVVAAVVQEMESAGIAAEPEDVVALLRRGTTERRRPQVLRPAPKASTPPPDGRGTSARSFYVFPVGDEAGISASEHLKVWLNAGCWGVRRSTPHRLRVRAGDQCCFYAKRVGIVARARIAGPATEPVPQHEWPGPNPYSPDVFKVSLADVRWLPKPVPIDAGLRGRLEAFADKDPSRPWSWFIQTTNRVSEADFRLLLGEGGPGS